MQFSYFAQIEHLASERKKQHEKTHVLNARFSTHTEIMRKIIIFQQVTFLHLDFYVSIVSKKC